MRIVFTGGGSGGHLYPLIAIAREIKRIAEEERILNVQLFYFGPEVTAPEVMQAEEIWSSHVTAGKFRRYFSLWNVVDLLRMGFGIGQALGKIFVLMPDVVFAKGGYGSFPTLLAARLYRIPVIIHESDAVPGWVNRWAGKWARRIAISFAAAAKFFPPGERIALTGVPLRKRILLAGDSDQAREALGISTQRQVIFALAGSQGARIINQTIIEILPTLASQYEIVHQAGEKNFEDVRLESTAILEGGGAPFYHLTAFLDEEKMRSAYLLAELVISRAGSSIFEIAAWGKPAILIPLKHAAQDHQRKNAYEYSERGAAVVIEEDNLTPLVLVNEIQKLAADPVRRKRMGEAARALAKLDAAEIIAKEILTLGLH